MENDTVMIAILDLCMDIDKQAACAYTDFSKNTQDTDLAGFWSLMAKDECQHVQWWKRLKDLALENALPPIFDDPLRMHKELLAGLDKIKAMMERTNPADQSATFIAGSRFEFFMQHRVFGALFDFIANTTDDVTVEQEYEGHVRKFITALETYGRDRPELEILGETLDRMWRDNMELAALSNLDPLTSAFNRRGMFQTITPLAHLAWRNNYYVAVLMIDIDDFKRVNDTHGHLAGDDVLRLVAATVQSRLRRSDVLGRYGGEEFFVFLSRVEPGSVTPVAENIRAMVEKVSAEQGPAPVTISIGAHEGLLSEHVDKSIDAFTRQADTNLYAAKAAGKNRAVVTREPAAPPA